MNGRVSDKPGGIISPFLFSLSFEKNTINYLNLPKPLPSTVKTVNITKGGYIC